jgi:3',5'-cyclic AMP phosphodiesterase CpdA
MKFIHLSDLHFHSNAADNTAATKTLKNIETGKNYSQHSLVVTGDITDDSDDNQFKHAAAALGKFKGRIYICPGNHDFGAAGNFYSEERAKRFDELLSKPLGQGGTFTGDNTPVVNIRRDEIDQVMLIALDTNLETEHPFDFACGEVGEEQLASLNTILSNPDVAGFTKILFFHHHPFMHGHPFMQLMDARALFRVVHGKVDVMLFGHKHVVGKWENVHGIKYILASDNSPGKKFAWEITVNKRQIAVGQINI